MGGFYTHETDKDGGSSLPAGHWMHGAMAKEKARLAKKKSGVGAENPTSPGSVQTPPEVAPKWPAGKKC